MIGTRVRKLLALLLGVFVPSLLEAGSFSPLQYDGHVELFYYWRHNEFDPNPCIPLSERAVARYSLELDLEHCRLRCYPSIFFFANNRTYFGNSRPQTDYNFDAPPIVSNLIYGAGFEMITGRVELRITHGQWIGHGSRYQGEQLVWTAASIRANFGN